MNGAYSRTGVRRGGFAAELGLVRAQIDGLGRADQFDGGESHRVSGHLVQSASGEGREGHAIFDPFRGSRCGLLERDWSRQQAAFGRERRRTVADDGESVLGEVVAGAQAAR